MAASVAVLDTSSPSEIGPDQSIVQIREVTVEDLEQIAGVHLRSFPESALSKLGLEAVRRYYLWQLSDAHEVVRAAAAYMDGRCVGFSFSGVFKGATSGFVARNRNFLIKRVVSHPWLLFNPIFRERLQLAARLLRRYAPKETGVNAKVRKHASSFGVLAIAVSPAHQKLGIGKLLMEDAEREARLFGFQQMHLSVNPLNLKAIRFYENLNWEKVIHEGEWKGSMMKILGVIPNSDYRGETAGR